MLPNDVLEWLIFTAFDTHCNFSIATSSNIFARHVAYISTFEGTLLLQALSRYYSWSITMVSSTLFIWKDKIRSIQSFLQLKSSCFNSNTITCATKDAIHHIKVFNIIILTNASNTMTCSLGQGISVWILNENEWWRRRCGKH